MKLLAFGKKFENLAVSIETKKIGSEFKTFVEKICIGEKVVFVCGSQMWGVANVSSEVKYEQNPLWKDKLYPYRANINSIGIFESPISFVSSGMDLILRETLGKQWAYKVVFTPGSLPQEAVGALNDLLKNAKYLHPLEYGKFLHHHIHEFDVAKRKRLGLL